MQLRSLTFAKGVIFLTVDTNYSVFYTVYMDIVSAIKDYGDYKVIHVEFYDSLTDVVIKKEESYNEIQKTRTLYPFQCLREGNQSRGNENALLRHTPRN